MVEIPSPSASSPEELTRCEVQDVALGTPAFDTVRWLNRRIFDEERIINTFDHEDLIVLLATCEGEAVGFKVGYRLTAATYYSAKGGVLSSYRRRGIARQLLHVLMDRVRALGYRRFAYDTFPNKHAGMTILGLIEGFRVTQADFNTEYNDYRLRLERAL